MTPIFASNNAQPGMRTRIIIEIGILDKMLYCTMNVEWENNQNIESSLFISSTVRERDE